MDINTDSETWIRNLQTTCPILDRIKPLARRVVGRTPTLEVGYLKTFSGTGAFRCLGNRRPFV